MNTPSQHSPPLAIILGGGITGLTVAWLLRKNSNRRVIILEKSDQVGGLAQTFHKSGLNLDVGSHRIHEQYDKEIFETIQNLLGPDLLRRPRHGLILIQNVFLKYPPSILQICSSFGLPQSLRFIRDYIGATFFRLTHGDDRTSFESFAVRTVGKTLFKSFYWPYALKLWGIPANEMAHEPAMNRVKKFQLGAFAREILNLLKKQHGSYFYYPAKGIGQLSEKLKSLFLQNGGEIIYGTDIQPFQLNKGESIRAVTFLDKQGNRHELKSDTVISTIPIKSLHGMVCFSNEKNTPEIPLRWRSLRILYFFTFDKNPSKHETFYLPEPNFRVGRISDISKYSPQLNPKDDGDVLTMEYPCSEGDEIWEMTDAELMNIARSELIQLKLIRDTDSKPPTAFSRKVKNLYPIYDLGWQGRFQTVYDRLNSVPNLFMVGREALYLHCNIDHCMIMARELAIHLEKSQQKEEWNEKQKTFSLFQVKD